MQNSKRVNPFVNRQPLSGVGREAFLERVRKGLGHDLETSPAPTGAPVLEDRLVRQVAADDAGRVDRFQQKMIENKGTVHRVAAEKVLETIDACLANHQIKKSLLNLRELGGRFGVAEHLQRKGIVTTEWGAAWCFDESFNCDASITDAPAGLADTGALLVWSDPGFGRSSTLVTPVHVTLLPVSRVLGDMVDGLEFVRRQFNGELPSNVVVINGPSKTGDIEMKLVTGVHGPKYMYVILIEGM